MLEKPTAYKKAATGNRKSTVQVSQGKLVIAIGVKRKPSWRHTGVSDLVLQNIQRKKKRKKMQRKLQLMIHFYTI